MPPSFDGTLSDYHVRYVLPNLLEPSIVEYYHRLLKEYCFSDSPIFIVRYQQRRTERWRISGPQIVYTTNFGDRFKTADNAPSWGMHQVLASGLKTPRSCFAEVLHEMPMHIHDVGGRLSRSVNISEKGWHVAHVFDVKDGDTRYEHWDSQNLIRRFIRTVHPCNFFYMPNLKGLPYGGRDDERAFYYDVLSKRHAGVWQEFSTLAGAAPRAHSCHASARITYDVASPTRFNSRNTINYKKLTRIPDDAVITVVNATLSGVGNDPTSTKAQQFAPIAANSGSTMMVIRKAGSREDYVRWFFAQGNLTIDDMTAANWPLRQ